MPAPLSARLADRRVGVVLSSGYFGFFGHTGFMQALFEAGIRPAALAGASAGALVAGFAAAPGGLEQLSGFLRGLRRRDFWDPALPKRGQLPGLLKGERFGRLLAAQLPVARFEDLDVPLVTVSTDLSARRRHVDTTGPLAPAIQASCALPPLLRPVVRDGVPHVDGGLLDKVPLRALLERHLLDLVLVHLLPSGSLSRPMPRHPVGFLNAALDLVRHDAWQQQRAWAEARGVEVVVIQSDLPRLGPFRLGRGEEAIAAARAQTTAALARA